MVVDCQASNDSSEPASAGVASITASDLSWEQVEEKDSRVTLWVPDHVVTHCAGCNHEFWMARRKHHCRLVTAAAGFSGPRSAVSLVCVYVCVCGL